MKGVLGSSPAVAERFCGWQGKIHSYTHSFTCEQMRNEIRYNTDYGVLLWFRSLDFIVSLLQKLKEEPRMSMEQAVEEAYSLTLKPWHGWISSAAFKVILLLHLLLSVLDHGSFV